MYTFVCEHRFPVLLGVYLGVEFLGHMVTLFNILGYYHTVLSVCSILQSHQQCMSVPISPHPQHLLLSVLFILGILVGCGVVSNCGFDLLFPND